MQPDGIHATVWATIWHHAGVKRDIEGAASYRQDFIEIPWIELLTCNAKHSRLLLGKYGLGAGIYGLRDMLRRLKTNKNNGAAVPVFDSSLEVARAGEWPILRSKEVIVCEGNCLLARQTPWDRQKSMFDLIVFVEELRRRIVGRWRSFGLFSEDSQKTVERGLSNGFFIASTAQIPICA